MSTRSNAGKDARRDFDGFDEDEELSLLRRALRDGKWRIAAELISNLDEHLCRGGSLPVGWLGPACMQEAGDLESRHDDTAKRAEMMTRAERQAASDFVRIDPEPAKQPGSSVGIHCNHNSWAHSHDKTRCPEALVLSRTTMVPPTEEQDIEELFPAQSEAAVLLGWRVYKSVWW